MPDQIALVTKQVGRKRGKLFDDKAFRRDLRRINKNRAAKMKRSFRRTTRTWEHQPTFHQITEIEPEPTVVVYTEDEQYGYVSGGTRVRRALMSPDFEAKTRPGALDSFPGRGGVIFVSAKLNLPGIRARNFPEAVEKKHKRPHQRDVERAIARAVERGL